MKHLSRFFILLMATLANASDDNSDFFSIPSFHSSANSSLKLTANDIKNLKSKGFTHDGLFTLTKGEDFDLILPYRWQIVTGWDGQFANQTHFDGHSLSSEGKVLCYFKKVKTYRFSNDDQFILTSNQPVHGLDHLDSDESRSVLYIDLLASPLGSEDFINDSEASAKNRAFSFGKLMCLADGEFDRQTQGGIRQNNRLISLLLMIAQQEGENIHELSENEQRLRGLTLFSGMLKYFGLNLDSLEDSLGNTFYQQMIPNMANHILKNTGIDPDYCPSDKDCENGLMTWIMAQVQNGDDMATILNSPDLKYLVPVHPVSDHKIKKIVSSYRPNLLTSLQPRDDLAVSIEQAYTRQMRLMAPQAVQNAFESQPSEAGVSVPWIIFRYAVLDSLERQGFAMANEVIAEQLSRNIPGGSYVCQALVGATKLTGQKSISDATVNAIHFGFNPVSALRNGIHSPQAAEMLDGTLGNIVGILPGGAIVYESSRCALVYFGYQSPAHCALGLEASSEVQESGIDMTAQILRSSVRLFVPCGGLMVSGAQGVAWYLGKTSLTQYVVHKYVGQVDDSKASDDSGSSSSNVTASCTSS